MAKGAGRLNIKFTSDIAKASQDIDKLGAKLDRLKTKASEAKWAFGSSSVGFENKFFTRPGGWEKSPAFNREVRAFQQAQQMGQSMQQQWNKSFGSFGMGGMASLGGSPFGPNPKAMVEARQTVEQISKKASIFSRIMGGVNEKTLRFMGSMGVVNPRLGMMATKFGLLGAVIVGLIGIVKHAVGQIAHFGNIIEQSRIVLKSIYGSDRKAVGTIRGMREFSRKTHHTPEEVVGATTMLAKYGLDPFKKGTHGLAADKHVMNLMSGLAAMPGMGGKPIGLDRAINAAIAGRDVRPLKALGPEAIAAYEKARQAGMSGTPEYVRVMIEELAKVPKIMALANEQADTMATMWSTITGYAEEFWMDLTGAGEETGVVTLWSQLKEILKDIRDGGERFITYIGPYVTELGAFLGGVLKFVWDILKSIWSLVGPILTPVMKILVQLFRIVWEVGKILMITFIQLVKVLIDVFMLPFRILNSFIGIDKFVKSIISGLMKIVLGLQITFMFFQIFVEGVAQTIKDAIDYVIYRLDEFIKKYKDVFDMIGEGIKRSIPGFGAFQAARQLQGPAGTLIPEEYKVKFEAPKYDKSKELSEMSAEERFYRAASSPGGAFWDLIKNAAKEQRGRQGDVTIINNETQRTDIEKVKNMSGSVKTQADKYRTGAPR